MKILDIIEYHYKEPKFVLRDIKDIEKWCQEVPPMNYISTIQLVVSSKVEDFYQKSLKKSFPNA